MLAILSHYLSNKVCAPILPLAHLPFACHMRRPHTPFYPLPSSPPPVLLPKLAPSFTPCCPDWPHSRDTYLAEHQPVCQHTLDTAPFEAAYDPTSPQNARTALSRHHSPTSISQTAEGKAEDARSDRLLQFHFYYAFLGALCPAQ